MRYSLGRKSLILLKKIKNKSASKSWMKLDFQGKSVNLQEITKMNVLRTREYRARIRATYKGTVTLTDSRGYIGTRFFLEHYCTVCAASFQSKSGRMMLGRGCPGCKTNVTSVLALTNYLQALELAAAGGISLYSSATNNFKPTRSYRHICNECHTVRIRLPNEVLRDAQAGVKCKSCERRAARGIRFVAYSERLLHTYASPRLKCIDKFSTLAPLLHYCAACGVKWKATVGEMLQGLPTDPQACACCSHTTVLKIAPVAYDRVTYNLRTTAELKALSMVLMKIPSKDLRTALQYPIPVIRYGFEDRLLNTTYVPSFMDHRSKLLISAMTRNDFEAHRARWARICDGAKNMGYALRLLIVTTAKKIPGVRAANKSKIIALRRDWYQREPPRS